MRIPEKRLSHLVELNSKCVLNKERSLTPDSPCWRFRSLGSVDSGVVARELSVDPFYKMKHPHVTISWWRHPAPYLFLHVRRWKVSGELHARYCRYVHGA